MSSYLVHHQQMDALLSLCKLKCTGSSKELAIKFLVSESTIKRMIDELRTEGHNIVFEKRLNTYIVK